MNAIVMLSTYYYCRSEETEGLIEMEWNATTRTMLFLNLEYRIIIICAEDMRLECWYLLRYVNSRRASSADN